MLLPLAKAAAGPAVPPLPPPPAGRPPIVPCMVSRQRRGAKGGGASEPGGPGPLSTKLLSPASPAPAVLEMDFSVLLSCPGTWCPACVKAGSLGEQTGLSSRGVSHRPGGVGGVGAVGACASEGQVGEAGGPWGGRPCRGDRVEGRGSPRAPRCHSHPPGPPPRDRPCGWAPRCVGGSVGSAVAPWPGPSHVSLDSVEIAELPSVPVFVTSWPDAGQGQGGCSAGLGRAPPDHQAYAPERLSVLWKRAQVCASGSVNMCECEWVCSPPPGPLGAVLPLGSQGPRVPPVGSVWGLSGDPHGRQEGGAPHASCQATLGGSGARGPGRGPPG